MNMQQPCPTCGRKPRSTHGAAYADDWTVLPSNNMKLLQWWRYSLFVHDALTKEQVKAHYRFIDVNGLNARISELLRLGMVEHAGTGAYRLVIERVDKCLSNGGNLLSCTKEVIM